MRGTGSACFRYELELLSWREPQLRDHRDRKGPPPTDAERMEEVLRLKAEAAPIIGCGLASGDARCYHVARDIYRDCLYHIEPRGEPRRAEDFTPPEGREEEARELLLCSRSTLMT